MIIAIALCTVAVNRSYAQGLELTKQQRKKLEAYRDSINHSKALAAIASRSFVVEADQLLLPSGKMTFVSPVTNFVSLEGDEAVIQVAPLNAALGANGVGGITLEGKVMNFEEKTDKKGNTVITMNVSGIGLAALVDIRLYKDDNSVQVHIDPTLNSNRITFYGVLLPNKESRTFKGRSF